MFNKESVAIESSNVIDVNEIVIDVICLDSAEKPVIMLTVQKQSH